MDETLTDLLRMASSPPPFRPTSSEADVNMFRIATCLTSSRLAAAPLNGQGTSCSRVTIGYCTLKWTRDVVFEGAAKDSDVLGGDFHIDLRLSGTRFLIPLAGWSLVGSSALKECSLNVITVISLGCFQRQKAMGGGGLVFGSRALCYY